MNVLFPRKESITKTGGDSSQYFFQNPLYNYFYRKRLDMVSRFIKPDPDGNLLDLAFGSGVNLKEFANKVGQVYGVDLHANGKVVARLIEMEEINNAELVTGFAAYLPFKDNSFDQVASVSLLCHIRELVPIFDEVKRVLKQDGRFIVGVPVMNSLSRIVFRTTGNYDADEINDIGQFVDGIASSELDVLRDAEKDFTLEGSTYFPMKLPGSAIYAAYCFKPKSTSPLN